MPVFMTRKPKMLLAVVIATAVIIALAVMSVVRSRRRIVAEQCIEKLLWMNGAKGQWALEHRQGPDAMATWEDIRPYLPWEFGKEMTMPHCPQGGSYSIGQAADAPTCS